MFSNQKSFWIGNHEIYGDLWTSVLFQELVSIDCKQAAQMVINSLSSSLNDVVKQLKTDSATLFEFLQGVMSYKWEKLVAITVDLTYFLTINFDV